MLLLLGCVFSVKLVVLFWFVLRSLFMVVFVIVVWLVAWCLFDLLVYSRCSSYGCFCFGLLSLLFLLWVFFLESVVLCLRYCFGCLLFSVCFCLLRSLLVVSLLFVFVSGLSYLRLWGFGCSLFVYVLCVC